MMTDDFNCMNDDIIILKLFFLDFIVFQILYYLNLSQ